MLENTGYDALKLEIQAFTLRKNQPIALAFLFWFLLALFFSNLNMINYVGVQTKAKFQFQTLSIAISIDQIIIS